MTVHPPDVSPSMRALRLHHRGGPDKLIYEEAAAPTAGTGDVLVQVQAASYTPGEIDWPSTWVDRAGRERCPVIPSHEVSGIVAAVGFGEVRLAVGDEVYGLTDWYRDGAAAELVAVEARNLALKPASITHLDACTLPLAGLTALQGLLTHGQLQHGQTVLIVGAAGGVGALAVQIARAHGARVIAAARAAEEETVMRLGADTFIDSETTTAELPTGVSLIFDTVGGPVLRRASQTVMPGGSIVSIVEQPEPTPVSARNIFFVVEPDRDDLGCLSRLINTAAIAPAPGARTTLAEAGELIAQKHAGTVHGKIAIDVTGSSGKSLSDRGDDHAREHADMAIEIERHRHSGHAGGARRGPSPAGSDSPIHQFLEAIDRLQLDAAVSLLAPSVRVLVADGHRAEGAQAVRQLLDDFIVQLRSTKHRIAHEWHLDDVWIAEVDASYELHDWLQINALPRALIVRAGPAGISELNVYGAHEHPLSEHRTGDEGMWVGGRWTPPL